MRSPSLKVAALLLSMACSVLAQPTFGDYLAAYSHIERREFAQVESLYAVASQQLTTNPIRNGAESFFIALRTSSGGRGGNTPEAAAARNLALQWVQASPTSVLAASFLGKLAARDAPDNPDWAAQERQISEAVTALERVEEQGRQDPMWNAPYITLKALSGATPAQTLALVRTNLPVMSEPGEMFFKEVVAALDLESTGALIQLKELSELAVQRTAKTWGTGMHAVIYLEALYHVPALRLNPFKPGLADWKTIDTALTDLGNQRPSRITQTHHAALACLAQDRRRAVELLTRLTELNSIDKAVWTSWGGEPFYERCKLWAFGQLRPA